MINSIKKCFFHDLVDDFKKIISSDWENHRCIQAEVTFHSFYLTFRYVQFNDYSRCFSIFFDVNQYDEADFIAESGRHDGRNFISTESNDNDSVYEKLQLMANSAVIGVLFRWFYGYLPILGIFPSFDGVGR